MENQTERSNVVTPDAAAIEAAHDYAIRNGAEHVSKITAAVQAAYAADTGLAALVRERDRYKSEHYDQLSDKEIQRLKRENAALVAENDRLRVEPETAAEDIRNALRVLSGALPVSTTRTMSRTLSAAEFNAIVARLQSAVRKLEAK